MDRKSFRPGNKLPSLIRAITGERRGEYMQPGEETWAVPWAVSVDEAGEVALRAGMVRRDEMPGGTMSLKVIKDFDGVYLDATALSQEELSRDFESGEQSGDGESDVLGVLYPLISDSRGLEPEVVERFNREQQEQHQQFAGYIRETFHHDYAFAWQEYPGYRSLGDTLRDSGNE